MNYFTSTTWSGMKKQRRAKTYNRVLLFDFYTSGDHVSNVLNDLGRWFRLQKVYSTVLANKAYNSISISLLFPVVDRRENENMFLRCHESDNINLIVLYAWYRPDRQNQGSLTSALSIMDTANHWCT